MFSRIRGTFIYAGVANKYIKLCAKAGLPSDMLSEEGAQEGLLEMYTKNEMSHLGFDLVLCSYAARMAANNSQMNRYGVRANRIIESLMLVAEAAGLAAQEKIESYDDWQIEVLKKALGDLDQAKLESAQREIDPFSFGPT